MNSWWIYLDGLFFSMTAYILIGPSKIQIARRQRQTEAQGSPLSLGRAPMEVRPPDWKGR
jgi:hypothetical protein